MILEKVEEIARSKHCRKVTLEVLRELEENNIRISCRTFVPLFL